MPPEGSWRPNVSLGSVLVSVHVLLSSPNLDDPVRPDLISEWSANFNKIERVSKENSDSLDINNSGNEFGDLTVKRPRPLSLSLSLTASRKKPKESNKQ